jgi:leucyl aminopeptidase (aminopeptidase T)
VSLERGFPGLLHLEAERHWTVFVSDFELARSDIERIQRQIATVRTQPLFAHIASLRRQLKAARVDLKHDYVSLQVLVHRFTSLYRLRKVFAALPHADMAQIDLPLAGTRFKRSFATHALEVVMSADYGEQDRISDQFFENLEAKLPYRVVIRTSDRSELVICDRTPWFHLAGRMTPGESRALPGGEVAYPGEQIHGTFTAGGALLASPEEAEAGRAAARLRPLSRLISRYPLHVHIQHGRVVRFEGNPKVVAPLERLLSRDERYAQVTEVGISFNRACHRFVHEWPAASNEGRPGVHIGIGGDPDRRQTWTDRRPPLVHIDLMSASSLVWVNDIPFLKCYESL